MDAKKICSDAGLSLPSGNALNRYYQSNQDVFPSDVVDYWTSDIASIDGFAMLYNTNTKTTKMELSFNKTVGTLCTKHYNSLHFSVATKGDPNQAPIAKAGVDQKVYYTESVNLSASQSSDDVGIVSYKWEEDIVGSTYYTDTKPSNSSIGETWISYTGIKKQYLGGAFGDNHDGWVTYTGSITRTKSLLSNDSTFSKTDFSIGTHYLRLTVTDEGGKSDIDHLIIIVYDSFRDILPMIESGRIKSKMTSCTNNNCITTLSVGSDLSFKITNDMDRNFKITRFEITRTYNYQTTLVAECDWFENRSECSSRFIDYLLLNNGFTSTFASGGLNSSDSLFIGYRLTTSETANYWTGTYTLTDVTTGTTFTNSFKYK